MELDALRNLSIPDAPMFHLPMPRRDGAGIFSPASANSRALMKFRGVSPGLAHRMARAGLALACAALAIVCAAQTAPPAPGDPPVTPAAGKKRPKIGLVLSGGGARGITHIGVHQGAGGDEHSGRLHRRHVDGLDRRRPLRDRQDAGRDGKDRDVDPWASMFSDSPPRKELTFREKQRDDRFPLPLEIGIRDGEIRGFQGALTGANLELFLHEITSNADGVRSFDALPVPFRCVATNMVTGKPYVFERGPLYQAMRSSMSIPGIFSPAEIRRPDPRRRRPCRQPPDRHRPGDGRRGRDCRQHRHAADGTRTAHLDPRAH